MRPTKGERNEAALILKTDERGRVRLPKQRQEALLDAFEKSGMSGQAFAAWAGVKYPTFAHWWAKRRKQRQGPAESKGWVEVVSRFFRTLVWVERE
jgi:hypothetical protein